MKKTELYKMMEMEVYKDGVIRPVLDPIVYEIEVNIIHNGKHIAEVACSPDALGELGVGYLIGQGLIGEKDRIVSVDIDCPNTVKIISTTPGDVGAQGDVPFVSPGDTKGTSPCAPTSPGALVYSPDKILELIGELDSRSYTFKKTGGVHSAALGSQQGILMRYEDIGRHNAVDKVIGNAFLKKVPLNDKCLVLSGRVSSEIVQKVYRNNIPIIISRSAPTLLAIRMASEAGMTIIGFARGNRFNIYSHSQRLKTEP